MTLIPFDDRDGTIWFDGKVVPWRDAKIHIISHGLHYASCVFEGERAYEGNIFKSEQHTQRLFNSAEVLGMSIPFTAAEINAAKESLLKTEQPDQRLCSSICVARVRANGHRRTSGKNACGDCLLGMAQLFFAGAPRKRYQSDDIAVAQTRTGYRPMESKGSGTIYD
jgi:branched-subunit amino acid aminotransferase/4-amino-4-deoxychorismate lyase